MVPNKMAKKLKVAIVCDWLTGIGGAERVVLELHRLFPEAPIYTSQYDKNKIDWFDDADIRTTWLQLLPKSLKKFLPLLRAIAFSRLNLSQYDLVISSSGAEAKAVHTPKTTLHINYCHSPTHYYWIRKDEYFNNPGFPIGFNWLAKIGLKIMLEPLKQWDKRAAKKPDFMIANSTHTQNMIKKYYHRDSIVIHPPVDYNRFKLSINSTNIRHGLLIAGRQSPYKKFDLAIKACNQLNIPLIVIGNGPDHKRLVKLANRNVTFLTNVNDNQIVEHFQSSLGFILPNMDDFGIVAVEALSAGTPVIAYHKGGALDYVKENQNGYFFKKQTVESLIKAIEKLQSRNFNYNKISDNAKIYSTANFKNSIKNYIDDQINVFFK